MCGQCGRNGHNKRSCNAPEGIILAASASASSSSTPLTATPHSPPPTSIYPKCCVLASLGTTYFHEMATKVGARVRLQPPYNNDAVESVVTLVSTNLSVLNENSLMKVIFIYLLLKVCFFFSFFFSIDFFLLDSVNSSAREQLIE